MAVSNSQGQILITNVNAASKVHVCMLTNLGQVQLYNKETKEYIPDFTRNNLIVTAKVYVTGNSNEQIAAGNVTSMTIKRSYMLNNGADFVSAVTHAYTSTGYKETQNMQNIRAIKYEFSGQFIDRQNSNSKVPIYGTIIVRKSTSSGVLTALCSTPDGCIFDTTAGHTQSLSVLPTVCDVYKGGNLYTNVSYQWQKYTFSDHGTQVFDTDALTANPTLDQTNVLNGTIITPTYAYKVLDSWAFGALYIGADWVSNSGVLYNYRSGSRPIFITGLHQNERFSISFQGNFVGFAGCTVSDTNGNNVTVLESNVEYIITSGTQLEVVFERYTRILNIWRTGMPYFDNIASATTNTLNVTSDMVDDFQFFRCVCTDQEDGVIAYGTVDYQDQTDPYKVVITTKTGDTLLNGAGSTTLIANVYQDGTDVTSSFTFQWYKYNSSGVAANWNGTSSNLKTTTINTLTVASTDVAGSTLVTCSAKKI